MEVDGQPADASNVVGLLVGSDNAGSKVQIRVRKHDTGQLRDVELVRVPMSSLDSIVALFKKLTLLKQNGHNNEIYETTTYPSGQATTLSLVDEIVSHVSLLQVEKHNHDIETEREFERLYQDMRSRLSEAYDRIEDLTKQLTQARTFGASHLQNRHGIGATDLAPSQLEELQALRRREGEIDALQAANERLASNLTHTQELLSDAQKKLGHSQGVQCAHAGPFVYACAYA